MKGQVVNLNRARWLDLVNVALAAAGSLDRDRCAQLGKAAGGMQAATPPATDPVALTGCLAFRWACQHFAFVDPRARAGLAPALVAYAWEVRRIFNHAPAPPEAAAVALPVQGQLLEPDLPRWTARADIGG